MGYHVELSAAVEWDLDTIVAFIAEHDLPEWAIQLLGAIEPSIVSRSPDNTTRVNLYDRLFEQQLNAGASALLATETVVDAYLDNKPATRGKQKYTRQQRDSDFWSSDFVNGMPSEAWQAEGPTLALARYLGQDAVANPLLLERIATASPRLVLRAVRYSGLVLQQHSPRRTELDRIAISNPDIAELCRILDIFDSAYRERVITVEFCKIMLVDLSPFEFLIYASLYAFEQLNPADFTTPWIPVEERNVTEGQWRAINDLLIWKLATATQISLRLKEKNLLRSLKMHLSPHLFPSRDGPPPRHDLRAAFETLLDAQIELNSFISQSADAFSFDDGIEFIRTGERALEIVERDPSIRAAWERDGRKLARIIGWTVSKQSPRGNPLMASAILDFWTSDLVTLAAQLRQQEPGPRPELFERPVLKLDQLLIQLPWILGLQNNSTAAINNLRRIGARRADAGLETRRIEEQLGRLFESRGFRIVLNWEPADESDARAGEVDLICALGRIVLVLEVKSTFIRQSQRDAWRHRTTTLRKAGQQLRRKVPAVERALSEESDLAASLNLAGDTDSISVHGWIVDTSIECDHERFSGFLKVSLEEVLIALRDDRHLLNDPDGILSGRYQKEEPVIADNAHTETSLYPSGFTVDKFMDAVEKEAIWKEPGS